jgi:hypothetical protein
MMMMMPMVAFFDLVGLAMILALVIYPIGRILRRIGWNPWLSLLWLVPGVNIVMLWVLAFGYWPTQPAERLRG